MDVLSRTRRAAMKCFKLRMMDEGKVNGEMEHEVKAGQSRRNWEQE